ncbi:MAG: hypothetical protein ABIP79_17325 [Chitinophagaceae bacterium]
MRQFMQIRFIVVLLSIFITGNTAMAQPKEETFTVENYYKIKWGYANDFIDLWKKNHYPLMKKAQEKGDIISIVAEKPMMHSGEDTRWDFKVTVTYKNAAAGLDHGLTDQYKKELYPDLDKLKKEEQHRFELLLAHWDVMTEKLDLTK